MGRTEYPISLVVNGRHFRRIVIDSYYRRKHPELSDELILKLVRQLSGEDLRIVGQKEDYEFFRVEPVVHNGKPYRLILVTQLGQDFLGVVNAFRVQKDFS